MINKIVNVFYQLAKAHKLIRSFRYDRVSKGAGIGEESLPQFFLEDPIYISNGTTSGGSVEAMVNFDIIMAPQAFENYNVKQLTEQECENVAAAIAFNIISRIRNISKYHEDYGNIEFDRLTVLNYSLTTLRYWYDNKASGVRVTLNLSMPNPLEFCDVEEHFNDDKEFAMDKLLSDIPTDNAEGCVNFGFKLSNFKI